MFMQSYSIGGKQLELGPPDSMSLVSERHSQNFKVTLSHSYHPPKAQFKKKEKEICDESEEFSPNCHLHQAVQFSSSCWRSSKRHS